MRWKVTKANYSLNIPLFPFLCPNLNPRIRLAKFIDDSKMINEWSKETGRGTRRWWWNKRRKRQANPFNQIFSTFYAPSVWTYVTIKVHLFKRGRLSYWVECVFLLLTHELLLYHSLYQSKVINEPVCSGMTRRSSSVKCTWHQDINDVGKIVLFYIKNINIVQLNNCKSLT